MDRYQHVVKALFERPWAILPSTLALMVEIVRFRASGGFLTEDEIAARIEAAEKGPRKGSSAGTVGVIGIYGPIMPRADLFTESSGATSVESIRSQLRDHLADRDVTSILFDIDSPGGSVEGIEELGQEIRESRGAKPMTALSNYTMASAAYWLGSQADEVVVTPSGAVGSIGVIAAHQDFSKAMEQKGVKTTLITHGKYKAEGNEFEPLNDEAKAEIQKHVDEFGAIFEDAVAKGRGVPIDAVRKNFGSGRMFTSKQAQKAGLVDRVSTYEDTLLRLSRDNPSSVSAQANFIGGFWQPSSFTQDSATGMMQSSTGTAELPFAKRLALVAEEVEAVVGHARNRAALRAEEGRELSSETREQLARLLALRPLLDEVEALVQVKSPRAVGKNLELLMQAYEAGYPIEGLAEGLMNE